MALFVSSTIYCGQCYVRADWQKLDKSFILFSLFRLHNWSPEKQAQVWSNINVKWGEITWKRFNNSIQFIFILIYQTSKWIFQWHKHCLCTFHVNFCRFYFVIIQQNIWLEWSVFRRWWFMFSIFSQIWWDSSYYELESGVVKWNENILKFCFDHRNHCQRSVKSSHSWRLPENKIGFQNLIIQPLCSW